MFKNKWVLIGGAFLLGAVAGALTGLPLSPLGLALKFPVGASTTTTTSVS